MNLRHFSGSFFVIVPTRLLIRPAKSLEDLDIKNCALCKFPLLRPTKKGISSFRTIFDCNHDSMSESAKQGKPMR